MFETVTARTLRKRRSLVVLLIFLGVALLQSAPVFQTNAPEITKEQTSVLADFNSTVPANEVLEQLSVKGRAAKTGYSRAEFGDGWAQVGACDMRNIMLKRSFTDIKVSNDGCVVLSGQLDDPYTGKIIQFVRGSRTSNDVQIDHVVALSDSWQKGAQALSFERRVQLANDPLNLLAVDGPANQQKGDSDAASWLPSNKSFRCQYVARQIAVKGKYELWVTEAEKSAMKRVLGGCENQVLPIES